MRFAGGDGGGAPFPDTSTVTGEDVPALVTEIVPLAGAVALGANTTLNEIVPAGGTTAGSGGSPVRLKKVPPMLIAVTVTAFRPVLVNITLFVEEVKIGTLPNDNGLGAADMPRSGSAAAENVTGLPVRPATDAVTTLVPAAEPRVRIVEAWPWALVLTTGADTEPPPVVAAKVTGTLETGAPPTPRIVTTNGVGSAVPAPPT